MDNPLAGYLTGLIISPVTNKPDLLFLLHDLARQLRQDADRRASSRGMTRAQWVILFWLERQPGLSQKELAEILEVEPITVARLIDRLEARDMVERRTDKADRRLWRLHLRPAALPVLAELQEERDAMHDMATAGLDPEALKIVLDQLCRMKANVVAGLRALASAERKIA
jgi:DNA-binding MarR family transcriptional regulator